MGCKHCGLCCKYPLILHLSEVEYDRKWVEGHDGMVKGMFVFIPKPCKWLGPDNLCTIYKQRPDFCRTNPTAPSDWLLNMGCHYFE